MLVSRDLGTRANLRARFSRDPTTPTPQDVRTKRYNRQPKTTSRDFFTFSLFMFLSFPPPSPFGGQPLCRVASLRYRVVRRDLTVHPACHSRSNRSRSGRYPMLDPIRASSRDYRLEDDDEKHWRGRARRKLRHAGRSRSYGYSCR